MSRPTGATIRLDALRHNLAEVRRRAPGSRVMAVIKANAYGHGIAAVAHAFRDADAFAVASLEEALRVRAVGLGNPVVLLEGVFAAEEQKRAAANGFEIVVHDARQLEWLKQHDGPPLPVWIKVDTGMHRLGFTPQDFRAAYEQIAKLPQVAGTPRLMTHLAKADEHDRAFTARQLQIFDELTGGLPGERSISNSAGTLAFPDAHRDWVRPGLVLYGVSPMEEGDGPSEGLKPAMTVATELIAVKTMPKGDVIGYGGRWSAPEETRYGIAAIGYGDGYPRHAGNGTPVLVNGERVPMIGRVSMDMIAVDLRSQPDARPGDRVVLWGEGLPVEEIARAAGTVPYELLCGVTQRVNFTVEN